MASPKHLTRAELEAFRARWQAVEQIEREEARRETIETRWRELDAIFEFAYEQGWLQPDGAEELAPVRARWARLKAHYS